MELPIPAGYADNKSAAVAGGLLAEGAGFEPAVP